MSLRKNVDADISGENIAAYRERKKAELNIVKSSDINAAMWSFVEAPRFYEKMAREVGLMTDVFKKLIVNMRYLEQQRNSAMQTVKDFGKVANKLLGDSTRIAVEDCGEAISAEDITETVDDNKFKAVLERIANAKPLEALKMTKDSYKIAAKTIGNFEGKRIKLANVKIESGSTGAEVQNAHSQLMRVDFILGILKTRKATLVETNLVLRRKIKTLVDKLAVDEKEDRELTEEEKAIIGGI